STEVERLGGAVRGTGDEYDLRTVAQALEGPRELDTVQVGERDLDERDVELVGTQGLQRGPRGRCGGHVTHGRLGVQDPDQLCEVGRAVVDDQAAQPGYRRGRARLPGPGWCQCGRHGESVDSAFHASTLAFR